MKTIMRNTSLRSASLGVLIVGTIYIASLFLPPSASAQSESASISGRVTDQTNAIVPDVEVELRNVDTGISQITKTNGEGFYAFTYVKPGNYIMSVRKQSFQTVSVTGITLNVQDNLSRNFILQIGSSAESITVTGDQLNVNTTDAAVGTVVDRQFVENMPLNGRSFQSLITLVPGVVSVPNASQGVKGEFSVNGQRTEDNYFTVDGVSANTGVSGNANGFSAGYSGSVQGETAVGTTQSLVSIDALQEFRVETSSYSAVNGRAPGGQFSFVTRSGTNDWHGSAYEYFRNDVFDANNWFNDANGLPKPPERQNDFGGTLGGPVRIPGLYNGRDHTFFFFSYEGLRLQTPQPAQMTQVPTVALRSTPSALQAILNSFPVPNPPTSDLGNGLGVFTATFSNPSTLDATSVRIDHSFSQSFRIFGRYSDTPSASLNRDSGNLAQLDSIGANIKTITVGATNLFSSAVANDFRFNYTVNDGTSGTTLDNFGGAKPFQRSIFPGPSGSAFPIYSVIGINLLFGSQPSVALSNGVNSQRQINVVDTLSISSGAHNVKVGFDYRRLLTEQNIGFVNEIFGFASENEILQNSASIGTAQGIPIPPQPLYTNFSAFGQDEWKVTQRVSLSLGLRWELNPAPGDANGLTPYTLDQITNLATAQLAPKGTRLWKTTYLNFAPRLGVAYRLGGRPGRETVLRAGFGVFYGAGNTLGSAGLNGPGIQTVKQYQNVGFPLSSSQLALPPPSIAAPYGQPVYAFDPNLKLPYTLHWNVAVQQGLGIHQTITVSYVAALGRRLLEQPFLNLNGINPNFASDGALFLTLNGPTSNYQALQIQFQRRLSQGLEVFGAYTWSHAIDDASSNFGSTQLIRGNADFDIRHNVQVAMTYAIPGSYTNRFVAEVLRHWSVDTRFIARSAPPFDILSGSVFVPTTGQFETVRADLVPSTPIYLTDNSAPGGRVVNINAFAAPANGLGDSPRNFIRGFSAWQADFAVGREFPLYDRLKLQFRAEAFNAFNHPNFGPIDNFLPDGPGFFGRATTTLNNYLGGLSPLYQVGSPRSLQFALKLTF